MRIWRRRHTNPPGDPVAPNRSRRSATSAIAALVVITVTACGGPARSPGAALTGAHGASGSIAPGSQTLRAGLLQSGDVQAGWRASTRFLGLKLAPSCARSRGPAPPPTGAAAIAYQTGTWSTPILIEILRSYPPPTARSVYADDTRILDACGTISVLGGPIAISGTVTRSGPAGLGARATAYVGELTGHNISATLQLVLIQTTTIVGVVAYSTPGATPTMAHLYAARVAAKLRMIGR